MDSSEPEATDATSDPWEIIWLRAVLAEKHRLPLCVCRSSMRLSMPTLSSDSDIPGTEGWFLISLTYFSWLFKASQKSRSLLGLFFSLLRQGARYGLLPLDARPACFWNIYEDSPKISRLIRLIGMLRDVRDVDSWDHSENEVKNHSILFLCAICSMQSCRRELSKNEPFFTAIGVDTADNWQTNVWCSPNCPHSPLPPNPSQIKSYAGVLQQVREHVSAHFRITEKCLHGSLNVVLALCYLGHVNKDSR